MVVSLPTSPLDHISTILHHLLHTAMAHHPSTLAARAWWVPHPVHRAVGRTTAITGAMTPWEEAHTEEVTSTGDEGEEEIRDSEDEGDAEDHVEDITAWAVSLNTESVNFPKFKMSL